MQICFILIDIMLLNCVYFAMAFPGAIFAMGSSALCVALPILFDFNTTKFFVIIVFELPANLFNFISVTTMSIHSSALNCTHFLTLCDSVGRQSTSDSLVISKNNDTTKR